MPRPNFPASLSPQYSGPQTLAAERARSALDVPALTAHLDAGRGGADARTRRDAILAAIEGDPLFAKGMGALERSRVERFARSLARMKKLRRLFDARGWDVDGSWMLACGLIDEMSPYYLHHTMFATTIREQASEAQKARWTPLVDSWTIMGAYSQTELGHGSNVRGLETVARYDPKTSEFVIHSPTLTASKWWNGALGRIATHTIVVAQLLLPKDPSSTQPDNYVSHGPQPFFVPIRDQRTQEPFPGIVVGDIGPKYGYATMDNGYMLFDHYRVPHFSLLSRYVQVDPSTGRLARQGHPATIYGSLTSVRAKIVQDAGHVLARAVTIAVRYTAVRRQFHDRDRGGGDGTDEIQVLDYPTVMVRVLPLLATAYALHYTAAAMSAQYDAARARIETGDFGPLAELHGTSSGLKSLCTTLAADGIETCRRAMGGHGFSGGSGLVGLNADYLSKPTVEGDNWMITQQVAAYLIKKMETAVAEPDGQSEEKIQQSFREYLRRKGSRQTQDVVTPNGHVDDEAIVEAFQWRTAELTWKVYQARSVRKEAWTKLMIELHKLSRAYSESMLVSNFYDALQSPSTARLAAPAPTVLRSLFRVFALFTMDSASASFITTSAVPVNTLDQLPNALLTYMTEHVRPHAVPLVDAWAIPDYVLDSALGRHDGKAYEALFEYAHYQNPMNEIVFNPYYWDEEIVFGSGKGVEPASVKTSKL